MNLISMDNAIRDVLEHDFHIVPLSIKPINMGRYAIICLSESKCIAMMLKDKPFMNFGYQFRSKGYSGVGDSVNVSDLQRMIQEGVKTIYTKFRDGKLYRISIDELLKNSEVWINKEGKRVRSFSIHKYERVN